MILTIQLYANKLALTWIAMQTRLAVTIIVPAK